MFSENQLSLIPVLKLISTAKSINFRAKVHKFIANEIVSGTFESEMPGQHKQTFCGFPGCDKHTDTRKIIARNEVPAQYLCRQHQYREKKLA